MNGKTIAPSKIYLQRRLYEVSHHDATWCADKIDDHNVEYVRADLPRRRIRELERQIKEWRKIYERLKTETNK